MSKIKKQISFETTFGVYTVDELIGEGGSGRVYGGFGSDNTPIAIKVLAEDKASVDKKKRFKNEIAFLSITRHPNIVTLIDHGISRDKEITGPFYVMNRYHGSLRNLMKDKIPPEKVLTLFIQILNGVEAAHLKEVYHRDLKPENILYDKSSDNLAIADFGIACFTEQLLATLVETSPSQRLANFLYAAPEQRIPGRKVSALVDIYALGLILNEMFTGNVSLGTSYPLIGGVSKDFSFLDNIVALMLRQVPEERPESIAHIKGLIQKYRSESISLQRISQIDGTVIKSGEIDDPLAFETPNLVGFDWQKGNLVLILNRKLSQGWINAFHNIRNYTSIMGKDPCKFQFADNKAGIAADENEVQDIINYFKVWLPQVTKTYKQKIEHELQQKEFERKENLNHEKLAEEQRLRILRNIKI